MRRAASLIRSAAIAAALAVSALCVASITLDTAQASGPGSDDWDEPDIDEPDFDAPDVDEPDIDNSGSGGGEDFDDPDDDDNSGSGSDDDEPDVDGDSSGHGGDGDGDDDDDNSGSSGGGGGNSGPGSANSGRDDNERSTASLASEETLYEVESDARGEYVQGEVIFIGTARDLTEALDAGFTEISAQSLLSGGTMARLSLPNGTDLDRAMSLLRDAAPNAIITPNTIYRHSQSASAPVLRARAGRNRNVRLRGTVGVIDTGIDASLLPRADALVSQRAFASARAVPHDHGAMVASIAVSHGARVHVADVFGRSADGALAASAERIAAALDWMVANRIAVVNISVEGPDNAVLQEMVRRAAEQGHIIVAAAGNGGPAARPTFPAAFDGVLAVTAIDGSDQPYIRANRGAYVDFAAHGVNVQVNLGETTAQVSGTSFAAPIIAAEAAAHLQTPSPTESARVVSRLRDQAEDLGAPGRDNTFGWGALRD